MSNAVIPPTQSELWQERGLDFELDSVWRGSDDDWRHGSTIEEVFRRDSDQTYWWVCYRKQTDGEYNGLRDGDYDICQVEPHEVTTIEYRLVRLAGEE